MPEPPTEFRPNTEVCDLYLKWSEQFDVRHAKMWAHRYESDPEAAMCEATYWKVLQGCGVDVQPAEDFASNQPSPDFRCETDDEVFYVEVTCLHMDTVAKETSLSHGPTDGGGAYGSLNSAIFDKVKQKTPQCADLDAPALVAVGTFHFQASCLCIRKHFVEMLLTGDTMISFTIDTRTGSGAGDSFLSTDLKSATFIRPNQVSGIEEARLPVSGVLIGGFGCETPIIYGLLHPDAKRPFNRELLDTIEFCQLIRDDANETLSVEWI